MVGGAGLGAMSFGCKFLLDFLKVLLRITSLGFRVLGV